MLNFIYITVLVSLSCAYLIILMHKTGFAEYMQMHSTPFFSKLFSCSFCMGFWLSLFVSLLIATYADDFKFDFYTVFLNTYNTQTNMITDNINGHTIRFYDSIDDMPIINFQKYNKYMLIDSGIGSDLEDINMHIVRVSKYIELDKQKALQELENMRQALMFICNSITPKYLAFVCLISEIDGEKLTDLSDDNISSILKKLSFVKKGHADDISEGC